jgi:hypothetical protein
MVHVCKLHMKLYSAKTRNWGALAKPSPMETLETRQGHESLATLKGDGAGDARIHNAVGVVQQTPRPLLPEAIHCHAQRPLHHGSDDKRHHSQCRSHDLTVARVLSSPALHTQWNRHLSHPCALTHRNSRLLVAGSQTPRNHHTWKTRLRNL